MVALVLVPLLVFDIATCAPHWDRR